MLFAVDGRLFLSTPSARRATDSQVELRQRHPISIHALREEGDVLRLRPPEERALFLSTPSARRATAYCTYNSTTGIFLSTPSARRATLSESARFAVYRISIHALREEGD